MAPRSIGSKLRKWRKRLSVAVLVSVLFAGAYVLLTSSWFLTRAAVPLIGRLSGVFLSFGEISWQPFRNRIQVRDLVLGAPEDPFLLVRRATVHYSPLRLLNGELAARRVEVSGARLFLHRDEQERWRFEKLLRKSRSGRPGEKREEPLTLPVFDIRDVTVADSEVFLQLRDGDRILSLSWHDLSVSTGRFANSAAMKFLLSGVFRGRSTRSLTVNGRLAADGEIVWNQLFLPAASDLTIKFDEWQGSFDAVPLKIDRARLHSVTRWEPDRFIVRRFQLEQQSATEAGNRIEASGEITHSPRELSLQAERLHLNSDFLMVFSDFFFGINPGDATLDGQGRLHSDFRQLTAAGRWRLDRRAGPATFSGEKIELPGFHFQTEHDFTLDFAENQLQVEEMRLEVTEEGRSAARVRLRSPVDFDLETEKAGSPPGLDIELDRFDVKLFRFLFPGRTDFRFAAGVLSGRAAVDFARNLAGAAFRGTLTADDVEFKIRGNPYDDFDGRLSWDSVLLRDWSLQFRQFELAVDRHARPLLRSDASLLYSAVGRTGTMKFNVRHLGDGIFELPLLRQERGLEKILAPFRPLSGRAEVELALNDRELKLKNLTIEVDNDKRCRLGVRLANQRLDLDREKPLDDWRGDISLEAPVALANSLLSGAGIRLDEGTLRFNSELRSSSHFNSFHASGRLRFDQVTAKLGPVPVYKTDLEHEFTVYSPDNRNLQFSVHNIYCRTSGQPAMRLEAPGSYDLATGDFQSQLTLRYCNERAFNLFLPGKIREAAIRGVMQLRGNTRKREGKLAVTLGIGKLRTTVCDKLATGNLQFELDANPRRFRLGGSRVALYEGPRRLLIGTLQGVLPLDPERAGEFQLHCAKLDLPALLPYVSFAPPPDPMLLSRPGSRPLRRKMLNFGRRELIGRLQFDDIAWGKSARLSLGGEVRTRERRLAADSLRIGINSGAAELSLHLLDAPDGLALGTAGRSLTPLPIEPITELLYGRVTTKGDIRSLTWQLTAKNLPVSQFASLRGRIDGEVSELQIDNQAARSPLVRVMLVPVEALLRVEAIVPRSVNVLAAWRRFWNRFSSLESPLARLRFDQGIFSLSFSDGKMEVERFRLTGDPISSLRFGGHLELTGDQRMALESEVNVSGLSVRIPIRGTLARPEVSAADLLTALTGGQVFGLFDRIGNLFFDTSPPEGPAERADEAPFPLQNWLDDWFGDGKTTEK